MAQAQVAQQAVVAVAQQVRLAEAPDAQTFKVLYEQGQALNKQARETQADWAQQRAEAIEQYNTNASFASIVQEAGYTVASAIVKEVKDAVGLLKGLLKAKLDKAVSNFFKPTPKQLEEMAKFVNFDISPYLAEKEEKRYRITEVK